MPYECTKAEWKILEMLWRDGCMSVKELTDALLPQTGWTQHAVSVLVNRLEQKHLIEKDEITHSKRYVCRLSKAQVNIGKPAVCMTAAQRLKACLTKGGTYK